MVYDHYLLIALYYFACKIIVPVHELIICGDFNQGFATDHILNKMFEMLGLEHMHNTPTCALSSKSYDMFDRMYTVKNKNYVVTCIPDKKQLLQHDYFKDEDEDEDKSIDLKCSFYSDHALLMLDICSN